VTGILDDVITLQELFYFERSAIPGALDEGRWVCNRMKPHNPKLANFRASWL
jgi:hypothetical protein